MKFGLSHTFKDLLVESMGLNEKQQKMVNLIERYWEKVSWRLKLKHWHIRRKAREQFCDLLKECMKQDRSCLFKSTKRDREIWQGTAIIPLPEQYK